MLPSYTDEHLASLATPDLWRLLIDNEDRVPRNLIDACAKRGDEILDLARQVLEKDYYWGDDQTAGEYWLLVHAIMILGLVPGERAGKLLAAYLKRLDEEGGENVASWFSGGWPALFRNKPANVLAEVRRCAENRDVNPDLRADAIDVPIACGRAAGSAALDEALAWAARIAFDEQENIDVRVLTAHKLLAFARPEHRKPLERLAARDREAGILTREDIVEAYARRAPATPADVLIDPWSFYAPENIEERQRQWAEDEAARKRVVWDEPGESYVREAPKVGRNDPCPCGSGKKYKKCCLNAAE